MHAKQKNYIYYRIARAFDTNLATAIEEQKNFYVLDMYLINILTVLSEAWNIKPRYGWSKARTLWYRILEGSNLRTKRG